MQANGRDVGIAELVLHLRREYRRFAAIAWPPAAVAGMQLPADPGGERAAGDLRSDHVGSLRREGHGRPPCREGLTLAGILDERCGGSAARARTEPAGGHGRARTDQTHAPAGARRAAGDALPRVACAWGGGMAYGRKSAWLNWSLNPRTRGSISTCRLQVTRGRSPGAAPVG